MDYTNREGDKHELVFDIGSLYEYLLEVTDTRKARGKRYTLISLLVLMLLAKLCGEDKPSGIAEWIAHRKEQWVAYGILEKPNTASHMTYRRVLQEIITSEELEGLVSRYHAERLKKEEWIVFSMDGKSLRGTIRYQETRGVHLLAIYVPRQGLVLAQAVVDRKENEIVVAPKILKQVTLSGVIVIADAMHTQKAPSIQIVEGGGDFIWTAKDNQSRTRWAIEKLFVHEVCNLQKGAVLSKEFQIAETIQKQHGRIEQRTLITSAQLNDYLEWPYVAQVFRLERIVWHAHGIGRTRQVVYGLTSLSAQKAGPEKLLCLLREYWGIESGLHYRRDVTLHEDATRLTVGKSAHNMAILNNLVIGLCLNNGYHNLASARRLFCAQPKTALNLLISSKSTTL